MGEKTTEKLNELSEHNSDVVKEASEKTKQVVDQANKIGQTTKELTASKLPSRLVNIPSGTSVPGCEQIDKCYDPQSLIIFKGGEVICKNDDSSAHTVTSGNIINGPNKLFDSGLIMPNETFSHKFDEIGEYDYFCMIHPWAKASVTVK